MRGGVAAKAVSEKENPMKKSKAGLLAVAIALMMPAPGWAQTKTKAAPKGMTLKVKLNYTGSGAVDEKHKIYVLVCDADPFAAERLEEYSGKPEPKPAASTSGQMQKVARILQRQGAVTKDGTVTFEKLPVTPVYAVAFYDKAGLYDGHADPASGSSMGQYGATPSKPDPIKLQAGKPTQVALKFDDSNKTP
jgi:hypothetical protein